MLLGYTGKEAPFDGLLEDELIHSRLRRRELFLALLTLLCPENKLNYFSNVLTMQTKQEAPHNGLITATTWVESTENNTTSVKSLS